MQELVLISDSKLRDLAKQGYRKLPPQLFVEQLLHQDLVSQCRSSFVSIRVSQQGRFAQVFVGDRQQMRNSAVPA
jgi:hypothetical protein